MDANTQNVHKENGKIDENIKLTKNGIQFAQTREKKNTAMKKERKKAYKQTSKPAQKKIVYDYCYYFSFIAFSVRFNILSILM